MPIQLDVECTRKIYVKKSWLLGKAAFVDVTVKRTM